MLATCFLISGAIKRRKGRTFAISGEFTDKRHRLLLEIRSKLILCNMESLNTKIKLILYS